jgi:hypothetical protein
MDQKHCKKSKHSSTQKTKHSTCSHRSKRKSRHSRHSRHKIRHPIHKHKHSHSRQERCNEDPSFRAPRLGACCLEGICSIEDERWCLENGGYWKGLNTNCWGLQCPGAALGACQTIQGCILTDEYNCPGIWMGPYTNCERGAWRPFRTPISTPFRPFQ